jgi:hypothetical protein
LNPDIVGFPGMIKDMNALEWTGGEYSSLSILAIYWKRLSIKLR